MDVSSNEPPAIFEYTGTQPKENKTEKKKEKKTKQKRKEKKRQQNEQTTTKVHEKAQYINLC